MLSSGLSQSSCVPGGIGIFGAAGVSGYRTSGTLAVVAAEERGVGTPTPAAGSADTPAVLPLRRWEEDAAAAVLEPIKTVRATLGTPAAFRPKTIQLPGGATPGSAGTVIEYWNPAPAVHARVVPQSSMRRESVSVAWVEDP
jgi:hypothetical protein